MPRRGENIHKRKDGRWEARYIKGRQKNGKAIYGYLYAKTYITETYKKGIQLLILNENMYQLGYISEEQYKNMNLEIHRKYLNHIVTENVEGL